MLLAGLAALEPGTSLWPSLPRQVQTTRRFSWALLSWPATCGLATGRAANCGIQAAVVLQAIVLVLLTVVSEQQWQLLSLAVRRTMLMTGPDDVGYFDFDIGCFHLLQGVLHC